MERNKVVVTALNKKYQKLEKDLIKVSEKVLNFLKQKGVEVEIYLVGVPKIRALNRQYRNKNEPTNVLAFPSPAYPRPKSFRRPIGEIYLCPPYIKEQGEDINLLLVHGLLHLTGFNHTKVSDRMTMARMERQLMEWLSH